VSMLKMSHYIHECNYNNDTVFIIFFIFTYCRRKRHRLEKRTGSTDRLGHLLLRCAASKMHVHIDPCRETRESIATRALQVIL